MKDSKMLWVWVGIVVVVVIVAAWFIWGSSSRPPVASAPAPVYAPQGQLVAGFPSNLILDSNAAINGSYSINYSSSTNQYTAEYLSSSTVKALYGQYMAYLPKNGWTVEGSLTTRPTFDAITASEGSNQLQVVISTVSGGSQVTITYAVKNDTSTTAQLPQWTNVNPPAFPPNMPGVPIISGGTVSTDRYYTEWGSSGQASGATIHGEYDYTVPNSNVLNQQTPMAFYTSLLSKKGPNSTGWSVTSSSSSIQAVRGAATVNIAFSAAGQSETTINILYTYVQ
jgi:hypothetical protein